MTTEALLTSLVNSQGSFEDRVEQSTGLTLRGFDLHFRSKSTSKIVQVSMHNRCNQSCGHCFQVETDSISYDDVDSQDIFRVLSQFDSDVYKKYLFPREPLLLPELLPLYKELGCTEISTNAVALIKQPELISLLHEYGIQSIFVSLHGNKKNHCALTRTNPIHYEDLLATLRLLAARGFKLEIITTLCNGNIEALDDLPELLIDIGVSGWWIQRIMPSGNARNWPIENFLYGDKCKVVMRKYAGIKQKYAPDQLHVGLDLSWGPNFYSHRMLQYLAGQVKRWPWARFACPAVSGDMQIISMDSGKVYPCWFLESFPETVIGELRDDLSMKPQQQLFSEEALLAGLQGICSECEYKKYCLGGCRSLAYSFAVKRNEPSPFFAGQDFCLTHAIEEEIQNI